MNMFASIESPKGMFAGFDVHSWAETLNEEAEPVLVFAQISSPYHNIDHLIKEFSKSCTIKRPDELGQMISLKTDRTFGKGYSNSTYQSGVWASSHPKLIIQDDPKDILYILSWRFNLPVLEKWAGPLVEAMKSENLLIKPQHLVGDGIWWVGGEPQDFRDLISRLLRSETIIF